jgi:PBP1b-binding outer membrane lipoprotein LpoB
MEAKKRKPRMKQFIISLLAILFLEGCMSQPSTTSPKSCINTAQLNSYSYEYLSRVAKLLREDKKNLESFEGFINVLKGTVDSYSQMIKSSVYISNVVRYLPIPYAGEVSNTTKLISKTVLNLGGAAGALNRYKKSSDIFLENFDKLSPTNAKASEISKLAIYADTKLLVDAYDLQMALREISSSTAMMAATTQSISDTLDATSGYLNQAKNWAGLSQPAGDDNTKVLQNHNSMNARVGQLNQKITSLGNSAENYRLNIEKARIYSELALQLEN